MNAQERLEQEFLGSKFIGIAEAQKDIKSAIGLETTYLTTKIDDAVDEDETEDTCVMVSSFTANDEMVIHIGYYDVTNEIVYIDIATMAL